MRLPAVAILAAIAAAASLPGTAAASAPPEKPLLVDPMHGTIGGLRIGQPLLSFSLGWAPPDRVVTAPPGASEAAFAIWRGLAPLNWAVVTFSDTGERHADSIYYAGPLRTRLGDRTGSTLAQVLRHWPSHGSPEPPTSLAGLTGFLQVRVGSTLLIFNAKKRLIGVGVGSAAAPSLAVLRL